MKKKFLLFTLIVMILVCIFAISVSAEAVYINHNGKQVSADDTDIAYELEIENPWDTGGGSKIKYIYLYDEKVTKIVVPEIELTHSNGTVYKMAEYSYIRLSTGYNGTLGVYTLADRETKANSLHAQITELEFHIPVLADGAGSVGNLANWTGLEKLSFYNRAYEPQSKGGFLHNCTSIKEIHFYGENNVISSNFFPSTINEGGVIIFHENATGTISSCAMQNLNGKDCTVYLNANMQPKATDDPRLTWNKNGNGLLKFVLLVNDNSIYTAEQIASYETVWQAGNNKNASNAVYSMPIQTYCNYYGEHINMEALSSCVSKCLSCNEIAIPTNPVHNESVVVAYDDFAKAGTKTTKCLNADCPLNTAPTTEEAAPLFTFKGYSTDDKNQVCVGYIINQEAIVEYEANNGEAVFKYGFVASANNKAPLDAQGNKANENVITVDLTSESYTAIDFKLSGDWSDSKKADAKISMNIYTVLTEGESTVVGYVYGYNDGDTIVSESYTEADQISYNQLNPVAVEPQA